MELEPWTLHFQN